MKKLIYPVIASLMLTATAHAELSPVPKTGQTAPLPPELQCVQDIMAELTDFSQTFDFLWITGLTCESGVVDDEEESVDGDGLGGIIGGAGLTAATTCNVTIGYSPFLAPNMLSSAYTHYCPNGITPADCSYVCTILQNNLSM